MPLRKPVLVRRQCESQRKYDVYVLNGFIYNGNNLTVAANYSMSSMSNMTNSMNMTLGNTAGHPQNYSSNARYVDASFFSTSSASLSGANDSTLDDDNGGYYTSLSQVLLYDLVDPQDYDESSAYDLLPSETLAEIEADLNQTALDASDVRNATSSDFNATVIPDDFDMEDQTETNDVLQLAHDLLSSGTPSQVRRRRRSLTWTDSQKTTARKRRASAESLNRGPVAPNAFAGAAQTVKTASSGTSQVASAVKTAVFGGDYKKHGKLNLAIGSTRPQPIYSNGRHLRRLQFCQGRWQDDLESRFL